MACSLLSLAVRRESKLDFFCVIQEPMQALEAERAIKDLKLFDIAEVGCPANSAQ